MLSISFPDIHQCRAVTMSREELVIAFCSQVGHEKVVHTVVSEECGSTITSANCFEKEASCLCKRPALQMYRPRGTWHISKFAFLLSCYHLIGRNQVFSQKKRQFLLHLFDTGGRIPASVKEELWSSVGTFFRKREFLLEGSERPSGPTDAP